MYNTQQELPLLCLTFPSLLAISVEWANVVIFAARPSV
jgi:hypothetical protein